MFTAVKESVAMNGRLATPIEHEQGAQVPYLFLFVPHPNIKVMSRRILAEIDFHPNYNFGSIP